jgi:hypothetical protein
MCVLKQLIYDFLHGKRAKSENKTCALASSYRQQVSRACPCWWHETRPVGFQEAYVTMHCHGAAYKSIPLFRATGFYGPESVK